MTRQLTVNVADVLERKYPSGFHVPADIDIGTFLEFADDDWDHTLDLDALLAAEDRVATFWSVDDVLCDLMHLADRTGRDFVADMDRARAHYAAETTLDQADIATLTPPKGPTA